LEGVEIGGENWPLESQIFSLIALHIYNFT